MLRMTVLVMTALGSMGSTATAQQVWVGSLVVIANPFTGTTECPINEKDILPASLRPKLSPSAPPSSLALFGNHFALLMEVADPDGRFNGPGIYTGTIITDRAKAEPVSENYNLVTTPAGINSATKNFDLSGRIDTFLCGTIAVRGGFTKR